MKNNLKLAVLAAVVLLASCSTEEATVTNTENDQMAEVLENTPLQANTVSDNVVINDGTKNEGMPPTPNEVIALDVSSSSKTALLGEGFDINLNTDANITGAYLQFKSNDGTVADSYYDIDLGANVSNAKFTGDHKLTKIHPLAAVRTDEDTTVDVDFNTVIEPGTFCYEVCVYDADGNISAPQEVCITVESWGGNAEIVGTWNVVRDENTFGDLNEVFIQLTGEEECDREMVFECESGETFTEASPCYTTIKGELLFNEDGTFQYEYLDTEKNLDFNASFESCNAVFNETEFSGKYTGNWAYVNDEDKFILIVYSGEYVEQGETQNMVNETGEGNPFVEDEGGMKLENGILFYTIDSGQGVTFSEFFEKE